MTLLDNLAPTPERLAKVTTEYRRPTQDRDNKREAHWIVPVFVALRDRGQLSDEAFQAAERLSRHVDGAWRVSGVTCAYGERIGRGDDVGLDRRVMHGDCLKHARQAIDCARTWDAIMSLIEETNDLETIGRNWLGCKQKGQAYIAGVALVKMGLERLARYWQMYRQAEP
jgi:hypothetical protein